jgi:hypothetical protein
MILRARAAGTGGGIVEPSMTGGIDLTEKLSKFSEYWSPAP